MSLSQDQEIVTEQALELASKEGHWVILQNIHLVAKWLPMLEKKLEEYGEGSHPSLRIYVSVEIYVTAWYSDLLARIKDLENWNGITGRCIKEKNKKDILAPPREGAYLNGLFMEGARWDSGTGSKLKESIYASDVCQGNPIGQNGNKEHLYLSSLQDT